MTPPLPLRTEAPSFDYIDLAELLEVIGELSDWLRVGTFDERPGEREAFDRVERVRARLRAMMVAEHPGHRIVRSADEYIVVCTRADMTAGQ